MEHEKIIELISAAAYEVFDTMLGIELTRVSTGAETTSSDACDGVVSFIGLAGAWAGTGSLSCSATLACQLSERMLMSEYPAVNEEVLDAVAELTNMVIGNVKSEMENQLGPMGLSVPTVVYGRNFTAKSISHLTWSAVHFEHEGERLVFRVCLAPCNQPQATIRHGFQSPYSMTL